jgi:hypothetical protein
MTLPFTLPFTLPDWLPAWAFLLLALPVLLWLLAFLIMPFNVFGVKSRLESLEAQVDGLQDELRLAAMRANGVLPRTRGDDYDEVPNFNRVKSAQAKYDPKYDPVPSIPPPLPAPLTPVPRREEPAARLPPRPGRRMEPRLD